MSLQVKVYTILRYVYEYACIQICVYMNSCASRGKVKHFGPLRGQHLLATSWRELIHHSIDDNYLHMNEINILGVINHVSVHMMFHNTIV